MFKRDKNTKTKKHINKKTIHIKNYFIANMF